MNKTLTITNVRTIFSIAKPIVVFEVEGHDDIVRNPKQALIDMQNSGRALGINPNEFNSGVEGLSGETRADFITALLGCNGAKLTGDISALKAGDAYVITKGHPALEDPKHKHFGEVSEGGTLKAETDSIRVEGFLSIPLTEKELYRRDVSKDIAKMMMATLGLASQAPQPMTVIGTSDPKSTVDAEEEEEEKDLANAVMGTKSTKK